MSDAREAVERVIKASVNVVALVIALPAAMCCWLEVAVNPGGEGAFTCWAHVFAVFPGHIGVYVRRAFYRLTLDECADDFYIGFGSFFSHRSARAERDVYVGAYAVLGCVTLREGCLIGTRASLLSGASQHTQQIDGRWTSDGSMFRQIEIGRNTWVGEGALIMADVGAHGLVSAGAVVSAPVPAGVVVAGNPARFVRQTSVVAAPAEPAAEATDAVSRRVPWLDWLKCLGMFLIVYGHVTGSAPMVVLRPILLKQLGVTMFLFAAGYSLMNDVVRPPWRVVFDRLFEIYLFGVPLALLLSAFSYATTGRLLISNYVPFVGANVVFDFFPANPTSWYIGTYIHFLVLWAILLRKIRISPALLLVALVGEIVVRAVLMQTAGLFVAYMLFTNWITVFLLGCAAARAPRAVRLSPAEAGAAAMVLLAAVAAWVKYGALLPFDPDAFPFQRLYSGHPVGDALAASAMVTATYVGVTLAVVAIVRALPAPRAVTFLSRNTLIVFLVHMPVYYALTPVLRGHGLASAERAALMLLVCFPGLALVSEGVRALVRPRALREWLFARPARLRPDLVAR